MESMMDAISTTSSTLETLQQIIIAKNLFLAALTLILLDHLLTLSDEVQYVWHRPKTFVLWLFLTIRYYAILALIVVAYGYFSPTISGTRCLHWSLFLPLGITMPLSIGPSILLSIRVYAMYGRSKWILISLGTVLCAQFAAGIWQYTVKGGRVAPDPVNNYLFHYCIYLPPAALGSVSSMYVFFELSFNTILFVLTLGRTFWVYWQQRTMNSAGSLLKTLAGNGAMYFGVIFCANLTWALMILHAPTGLRGIMSQPTAVLTTIMMSRITLNLRSTGARTVQSNYSHHTVPTPATPRRLSAFPRKIVEEYDGDEEGYAMDVLGVGDRDRTRYSRMPRSPVSSVRFARTETETTSFGLSLGVGSGFGGESSPGVVITSHTETFADLPGTAV